MPTCAVCCTLVGLLMVSSLSPSPSVTPAHLLAPRAHAAPCCIRDTAPKSVRSLEEGCGDGDPPAAAAAAPELRAQ